MKRQLAALSGRDRLFALLIGALFVLLVLYGAGMIAVTIWGDARLAAKLVNGFVGMFTAIVGLGTGYLLGKTAEGPDSG